MSQNGVKLIAAIREVAAEQPERVYKDDCVYVVQNYHTGECRPGCLVGQGGWRVGLIDASWADDPRNEDTAICAFAYEWHLDDDEVEWLATVQNVQDGGRRPWREAVMEADAIARAAAND